MLESNFESLQIPNGKENLDPNDFSAYQLSRSFFTPFQESSLNDFDQYNYNGSNSFNLAFFPDINDVFFDGPGLLNLNDQHLLIHNDQSYIDFTQGDNLKFGNNIIGTDFDLDQIDLNSSKVQVSSGVGQAEADVRPLIVTKSDIISESNENISENSSFNPCLTRNDNSDKDDTQLPQNPFHKRKRKRKIDLTPEEKSFKYDYYKFFTNKKKFSKDYVIAIHKIIMNPLGLQPITRDQTRQIDLYFQNFAFARTKIFDYITKNKEELSKVFV